MRNAVRVAAVALLLLACVSSVLGMAREYSPAQPIMQQSEWPAGLAGFLNAHRPVYGYLVNSSDYFFYRGDASAFNAFLQDYSKLRNVPLVLVLHSDPLTQRRIRDKSAISADWSVLVVPPMIPDGGIDRTSPYKRYVTVNLWLGGGFRLTGVRVPLNVEVVAGKDLVPVPDARPVDPRIACHMEKVSREAFPKPELSVYLLQDTKVTATQALKTPVSELVLQKWPLFTVNDIVSYKWSDHSFVLKPAARDKVPDPPLSGIPFVIVAGGRRAYMGAFWSPHSSYWFPGPAVSVFGTKDMREDQLTIGCVYVDGKPYGGNDPRNHADIKAALTAVCKLVE